MEFPTDPARMRWRHIIVTIVVSLWVANMIGAMIGIVDTNPYLHAAFFAVLGWVLGIEVSNLGRRKEDNE